MRYVVLLYDGMVDYPVEELDGKTLIQAAHKPYMDSSVKKSQVGLVKTVMDHLKSGGDVANLSVLGYDPAVYYTGRSPLEVGSIGTGMKPTSVSPRRNLVILSDEPEYADRAILGYYADDASTEETEIPTKYLAEHFGSEESRLYSSVGYRRCLIWNNGTLEVGTLTPPHDITDRSVREYIPTHPNAAKLYDMMVKSYDLLKDHLVNRAYVTHDWRPTNSMWPQGEGVHAQLSLPEEKHGLKDSMTSAVDLPRGIGKLSGMRVVHIEGATGYINTSFEGKARAASKELANGQDFVYIHVEAPNKCGHRCEIENKVKPIEYIDGRILKLLLKDMEQYDDYNILVAPDRPTPLTLRIHTNDPVPFLIYRKSKECSGVDCFLRESAAATGLYVDMGHLLVEKFIEG